MSKQPYVLGLDPGFQGQGVFLGPGPNVLYTFGFSTHILNKRRMYRCLIMFKEFLKCKRIAKRAGAGLVIVIEDQRRWAKLMMGFGVLLCLAELARVDKIVLIAPVSWQRTVGIQKADKALSIAKAKELLGINTKDHNVAEAGLVAFCQYNKEAV